jgi:hypothetical protein
MAFLQAAAAESLEASSHRSHPLQIEQVVKNAHTVFASVLLARRAEIVPSVLKDGRR